MHIEHIAFQVHDPVAMADWYVKHFGFSIARAGAAPTFTHFLRSSTGVVMIEIYRNPSVKVPDYRTMDPLILHLAFVSENPAADRDRLVKAGARVADDIATTPAGDEIVMLRDPWDIPLQFVKRVEPMLLRKF